MAISFNQVPANIRVPFTYIEFDNARAVQGATVQPYKLLVIGQRRTTGTVAALTPTLVSSAEQAASYFGAGSMLHNMAESLFANNGFTEAWFCALADNSSGVAAAGTVVFSGTPTEAGTLNFYIAGRRVQVAVTTSSTANSLATALAAKINADTSLPVTAAADTATVTITARHKGENGNQIDTRLNYYEGEVTPAGVVATITQLANGAGNPDIGTVWAVIGDTQYNVIANPYTDTSNLTALETELADRWGPLRQNDGMAFSGYAATHGSTATFGQSRNSPHSCVVATYGSPSPAYEWAAAVAGIAAYYLAIDPARPLQTLPIAWVKAPLVDKRFILSERNTLLFDGISTTLVDSGGQLRIERLITTYQKNAFGAADTSYLDVEPVMVLSLLRYSFRTMMQTKYPRHKLADDGTRFGPGQAIITPNVGKTEALALFRQWEEMGLVEDVDQFKNDLIVERNASDPNRLDFLLPPNVVNGLRVLGVQIGFLL